MAKRSEKNKIEIIEVQTPKVDNRLPLEEVIDQLAKKAGSGVPATTRTVRARSETGDRLARIKELSTQLAQELRALKGTPAAAAKAPSRTRKRSK